MATPALDIEGTPPVQDAEVSVGDADVKGCGDAGAANDIREPAKEKGAGKEMTAALAPNMDGAPPVQDAEVSVGAVDVEGCGGVRVARDVHEEVKRRMSAKRQRQDLQRTWRVLHLCRMRKSGSVMPT